MPPLRLSLMAALASLALSVGWGAPAARGETLAEAISLAYRSNPELLAQRAALRALDETYNQARAAYGPTVSIGAQGDYQAIEARQANFLGGKTTARSQAGTLNETLSLTQPIYTGGQTHAQVDAARAQILSGRQQLRQAEAQVLQNVVTAYVGVRQGQAIRNIGEQNLALLAQQLRDAEARFAVHEVTLTDRAQAQARLAAARTQLAAAQGQLDITRTQYLAVVGQNPGDLAPEPDLPNLPKTLDDAFNIAERNNPALLAAVFAEQVSQAQVIQAKAASNATLSVQVQAASAPTSLTSSRFYDHSITALAVLNKPLFTSGLNASRVRQALEQNSRDRMLIESNRRAMVQAVAQAWSQLVTARLNLKTGQEQVRAEEVAYAGVQEELKVGLRTTLDVLNAEQELQNAEIQLVQSRHNEYLARAALLAAMGLLEAKFLAPQVEAYSPEAAFRHVEGRGGVPWEGPLEHLDRIGAPKLKRGVIVSEPAGHARPDQQPSLPEAPPADAPMTPPLIMPEPR